MPGRRCIDASLALHLLLPDERTSSVEALWRRWIEEDAELVAPPLFFAEVTSVLRESVSHNRITSEEGEDLFSRFLRLSIRGVSPEDLQQRAWDIAKQLNLSRGHDAQYLAAAQVLGCELWTGDHRLTNAAPVDWVKWGAS